jgi:eukaryotic-like serine/threonine-protein kinase
MVREALEGRYVVAEEVASGGAARVFLARDPEGQRVALKVLRPELLPSITAQRFLREIEVLKQLDHPFIAKVLDSGERDYVLYYTMAWIEGPTLRAWLDKNRVAPLPAVIKGSLEILDAVAHAHSRGIVHRDVKPENVVLNERGAILLDFGIARAIERGSEGPRLTRSGFTVGTSHYMSPEQAGGLPLDHRSDIYSLGCMLYECLAGEPPYTHSQEIQILGLHQRAPVPDVRRKRPEVSKPLARVVERAMAKQPGDRYQSAGEMRVALMAAVA